MWWIVFKMKLGIPGRNYPTGRGYGGSCSRANWDAWLDDHEPYEEPIVVGETSSELAPGDLEKGLAILGIICVDLVSAGYILYKCGEYAASCF
jgi:hypothetical protein